MGDEPGSRHPVFLALVPEAVGLLIFHKVLADLRNRPVHTGAFFQLPTKVGGNLLG